MKTEKFDFYDSSSIKSYNLDEKIRYQLKMLDGLDAFTRRHCEHVAAITCRLCENLHLDKGFTIYCVICAYLHDLGKIFIPPAILQKTSKLTDEEYEVMKTHTTIGYNMCMKDPKLRPYAAGALYHHEGLDGSGYPNGVVGKDIPYEAQIIRVADEFEAITAKRQYKTHIGIIETLNILIDHATPTVKNEQTGKFRFLSPETAVGKIDKKILRALFKMVIDDTEYEISVRSDYLVFLKSEIKRLKTAMKYYEKMEATSSPEKKEYFKETAKYYLHPNEVVEKLPAILSELENAYTVRSAHIDKLYNEAKKIKNLRV